MLKASGFCVCCLSALLLAVGCGGSTNGTNEGSGGGGGSGVGGTGNGGAGGEPPGYSSQVDLLLVVDNSAGTKAHHERLAESAGDLIRRLQNPDCVGGDGSRRTPSDPGEACPEGTERLHAPVSDLNVGVITSSLGTAGGDYCQGQNDQAHLLPTLRDSLEGASPEGVYELREGGDVEGLIGGVQDAIRSTGQSGCGFEMPLEAMFRFLADPKPYGSLERRPCSADDSANACVEFAGTDEALLAQRAAFLRPGSTVVVVMVGDENDCSVVAGGQSWIGLDDHVLQPRPTQTCATDPNSECCYSCQQAQKAGCPSLETECTAPTPNDELNLRCWDQKRRLGIDFLYPVDRYVAALRSKTIDHDDESLVNALFADGTRSTKQVHFLTLGGAPPGYLTEMNADGTTRNLSNAELASSDLWAQLVGDPSSYKPPQDPFMVESDLPRTGVSKLNGISPADTNAVNGGDEANAGYRLQYACLDPLSGPLECPAGDFCLCDKPDGNAACSSSGLQIAAPAYPTLRQFAVAQQAGGEIGSLCEYGKVPDRVDTGFGASYELLQQALESTVR